MLLPHGYEGQGPEHSSARMERFLTLCGDDNMRVVNPTTPGQFFHVLRRQVLNPIRKPIVVFTPKGLLRHPGCISRPKDLIEGSFQEILDDPASENGIERVVFCSGRIYYDLVNERSKAKAEKMAFIRFEQLYPLNVERLKDLINKYKEAKEFYWAQEEHSNMGAWEYIRGPLTELLPKGQELKYVGRKRSASPAAGSYALHKKQYAELMAALFGKK
jgi:2-oxoglutarate dehydrogenase E1 component